jgi:hypothetical protein
MVDTDPFQDPLPKAECPQCGEAMEGARESAHADVAARAIFRCANGHTVIVELVEEYDDDGSPG